jgi:hypothetical protein
MAVPTVTTYAVASLVAAHEAFLTLVDTGAGNGSIRIRDSSDVLLAEIDLDDPAGTVAPGSGQLTFAFTTGNALALVSGAAAYGEVCDVGGTPLVAMPAAVGVAPSAGYIVISDLGLTSGIAVTIISATLG